MVLVVVHPLSRWITALYNCVTSHTGRARVFLPPGHCHRAGGHQLGGGHDHQVAHVDQEVQHRHHGDGDQDSPGKIHLQEGNIKDMSLLCFLDFIACLFLYADSEINAQKVMVEEIKCVGSNTL